MLLEKLIMTSESWILLDFELLVKRKDGFASGKRISF